MTTVIGPTGAQIEAPGRPSVPSRADLFSDLFYVDFEVPDSGVFKRQGHAANVV